MMSRSTKLFLFLSAPLICMILFLAWFGLEQIIKNLNSRTQKMRIIVASFDINKGEIIEPLHFKTKKIFEKAYLETMVKYEEENKYFGYIAGMDIPASHPIFKEMLKPPSEPEKAETPAIHAKE